MRFTDGYWKVREDCIAVRAAHHFGGGQQVPAFYESKGGYARVHATEEEVVIRSGNTEARIARAKEWRVEFFHNGRKLTQSGWRSLGYAVQDSGERFMKEELQISVGENIFGLGERFTPFIKNGQSV